MKHLSSSFLFLFFLFPKLFLAQADTAENPYYKKYSERLVVALFQSERSYELEFRQKTKPDSSEISKMKYSADANQVTGIELDYDKFSVSFGFKSTPPDQSKKGKTRYSQLGVSFGGTKWRAETGIWRYKGFYDKNTEFYDTAYSKEKPFYQNPSMTNEGIKAKFLYFFNHEKFAFPAAYSCTYLQFKTALSWVGTANIFYSHMFSDTSFIPPLLRSYYGHNSDLNYLSSFGFSAGGGFSGNLVLFRSLFLNLTFVMGLESQWRDYGHFSGENHDLNYLTVSGDGRASLGYNGRNFFITLSSLNDFRVTNGRGIQITGKFLSGAFTLGYRFKVKDPEFMSRVRETKIYQLF